jgi:hypothetical protein
MRLARVPRVESAVSVIVVEVIGLPRHRRGDDGDVIFAESSRTENEGCVADLAPSCDELGEVEPARPLADSNPDRASRSNSSEAPSGGDGGSEYCVLRGGRECPLCLRGRPGGIPGRPGSRTRAREVSGGIALSRESSLDGRPVGREQPLRRPSDSSRSSALGLLPDTKTQTSLGPKRHAGCVGGS